ncbi:hypothetical protein G9C98_006718, partial [Cotesia typhae]
MIYSMAEVIITPTFPCPEDNIPFNSKALDPASDNGSQVLENKDHIECNPIIIDMYPYDEEISINTCEPITDILETLKSSVQGLAVLYYYKNHRTFNDFYRNLLSDVIVSTEMRTNHSLMITPERLHELALLIPESRKKQKILARGKFHTRYNHWKDILIQSGSTPNCRGLKRKIIDESAPVRLGRCLDIFEIDYVPQDYEDQLNYFKTRIDPWDTIENYWEKTSSKRIQDLISDNKITSSDYLKTFVALRNKHDGLKLIDIDFNNQYPNQATRLIDNYKNLEKKLYTYCDKKKKKNAEIKTQLNLFKENIDKSE